MFTLVKYALLGLTIFLVVLASSETPVSVSLSERSSSKWERRYKFLRPGHIRMKGTKKWNNSAPRSEFIGDKCSAGSSQYLGRSSSAPAITPFEQGDLGSCGPNAVSMALEIAFKNIGGQNLDASRMWLYKMGRLSCLESGTPPNQCIGTQLSDIWQNMKNYGFLKESQWPYDGSVATDSDYVLNAPAGIKLARRQARQNRDMYFGSNGIQMFELTDMQHFERMIDDGIPVLMAYTVWEGTHKDNGKVDFTDMSGDPVGGHAVLAVGYSKTRCAPPSGSDEHIIYFLNSWGSSFGENGIGKIPRSYFISDVLNAFGRNRAYAIRFTDGQQVL